MTPAQYNGLLAALGASPGILVPFAGAAVPSGFLLCDGAAVSRAAYAPLFAAIGVAFGAGDGVTTFNLPDMRSRFPVGAGQGSGLDAYTLGQTGADSGSVIAQANLPAASLAVVVDTTSPANGGNAAVQGSNTAGNLSSVAGAVALGGSATPLPVIPPYIALNWAIKT